MSLGATASRPSAVALVGGTSTNRKALFRAAWGHAGALARGLPGFGGLLDLVQDLGGPLVAFIPHCSITDHQIIHIICSFLKVVVSE